MIRFALRPAALAAGLFVCGAALADDVDADILKAQAGTYLIAPSSGEPGCRITLETGTAIGGYSLSGTDSCSKPLPALAAALSWNFDPDGGLILIDATRKVLARFVENEGSPLETEDEQQLFMLDAPKGLDRLPTLASLAGNWTLQRPSGEKLCTLALKNASDADGNAPVSAIGDCSTDVTDLKLSVFHVEGLGLVLMSKDGTSISFDMVADGKFEKSPEDGGKPLLLIKNP
jgi:hypothetical protein